MSGSPEVPFRYREFAELDDGSIHRSAEVVMQRFFGLAGIRAAAGRIRVIDRIDRAPGS